MGSVSVVTVAAPEVTASRKARALLRPTYSRGAGGTIGESRSGALKRARDRLLGAFQSGSNLPGVIAEDVAQDEYRALAGGDRLQGGYERKRDSFLGLVSRLRPGSQVGQTLH